MPIVNHRIIIKKTFDFTDDFTMDGLYAWGFDQVYIEKNEFSSNKS